MRLNLIAAIDKNHGIGNQGQLLCHLPKDLRHFKEVTMGCPIIMGSNTFRSIGKALPGRQNIVLSQQQKSLDANVLMAGNIDDGLSLCAKGTKEVFFIGGAMVYQAVLPLVDRMYITHIEHTFKADTFFPKWLSHQWKLEHETYHNQDEKNPYAMRFCLYSRIISL